MRVVVTFFVTAGACATALLLLVAIATALVGHDKGSASHTPSARLIHAGMIVGKATETVDGHPHCFVTISAKDTAGTYYKRTDEVNCWLYRNELKIGSWWQFAD